MDGVPILDYTPEGLLGLFFVLIFFGRMAPWPTIKQLYQRIAFLESSIEKLLEAGAVKDAALRAEQDAHAETSRQLTEEQKTGEVVRHFIDGLGQAIT